MEDKLIKTLRLMILGLLTICSLLCQAQEDKAKMDRFHKLCKAGRYLEMSQVFSNHDSISPYTNLYSKVYSAIANNQNWSVRENGIPFSMVKRRILSFSVSLL